jgi:hypothetical protein
MFFAYSNLALVHLFRDRDAAATDALGRSLEFAAAAQLDVIEEVLGALAALAARRGDLEQAARLAGAGRVRVPATLYPGEQRVRDIIEARYLAPARRRLGEDRWDRLAAESAALDLAAAIHLGLRAAAFPA